MTLITKIEYLYFQVITLKEFQKYLKIKYLIYVGKKEIKHFFILFYN